MKHASFLAVLAALAVTPAGATVVRFETVLGDIDVRLFDTATPASVANFLNYVADGDYDESFIHRAPPGFVLQGGGFRWLENDANVSSVPTDAPVVNEPGLSNLEGTLAYAKLGGDPNSATSGWFFSVGDNSANLDFQNGGFTVFGRVLDTTNDGKTGMEVIDDIAALRIANLGGAFETLPVLDTAVAPNVFRDDLVFVNTVTEQTFAGGDYDFDGDVDSDDYAVWQSEFGNSLRISDQPAGTAMNADGNGDGVVDAADYTIWRDGFVAASAGAVPEPLSAMLAALGVLSARAYRR